MGPAKTQISVGIRPVWSVFAVRMKKDWVLIYPLELTHWVHSEDSDQTGRMPRLIWVFAGRTVILLVSSWGGSGFECSLSLGSCDWRTDWITEWRTDGWRRIQYTRTFFVKCWICNLTQMEDKLITLVTIKNLRQVCDSLSAPYTCGCVAFYSARPMTLL